MYVCLSDALQRWLVKAAERRKSALDRLSWSGPEGEVDVRSKVTHLMLLFVEGNE
jgi:hypothetical protein